VIEGSRINAKLGLCLALAIIVASPAWGVQLNGPSIVSGVPDVRATSEANAAGVLEYCMKHGLVSRAVAEHPLERITARPGVAGSADYSAGLAGRITSGRTTISLDQTSGYLRSRTCDVVLRKVKELK